MKGFFHLGIMALVATGTLVLCPRVGAQGQAFGYSVATSAGSIFVSNSVTYTIALTNQLGEEVAVLVTNQLSGPYVFVNASSSLGSYTNTGSQVIFNLPDLFNQSSAALTFAVQPQAVGLFTNSVAINIIGITNISINVVIQVTNAVVPTDLGVTIAGPVQAVITNDWMTYTVTATNLGPNTASSVSVTNTLPYGVILKNVSPPNYSVAGSNLIFNLGTLASDGFTILSFTVQPTNAGDLTFSASIGSPGLLDTNLANNSASTNISVIGYLPGTLVAFTNSGQSTNFISGLLEQSITVTNTGTNTVPAVRVVVTSLTNRLFNAVGTNNGNPFVYDSTNLAAGQSVNLLLQYFPRKSFAFTNSQLQAFAVPVPNWTPPATTSASTNLNLSRIVQLPDGKMLIEWPAITNRTYTVVYSDNILFSNAMIAPPSIVAPANDVEWIDYGPPTTVSDPTNASSRFYRVFLNQ